MNSLKCERCCAIFTFQEEMDKHVIFEHQNAAMSEHECEHCGCHHPVMAMTLTPMTPEHEREIEVMTEKFLKVSKGGGGFILPIVLPSNMRYEAILLTDRKSVRIHIGDRVDLREAPIKPWGAFTVIGFSPNGRVWCEWRDGENLTIEESSFKPNDLEVFTPTQEEIDRNVKAIMTNDLESLFPGTASYVCPSTSHWEAEAPVADAKPEEKLPRGGYF
jgi:uncharacterized protein YodC (DUF2158 family)